ncbi:hypothetical protein [Methylobacterium oxalidis]|uniref:hypothetical protein n=1 Tax=Methylobacterium oxalidis TaxID=944322 RepID=UPI003314C152
MIIQSPTAEASPARATAEEQSIPPTGDSTGWSAQHQADPQGGAETLLVSASEALMHKTIELALAGNVTALRYCNDRLASLRAARPVPFALPEVKDPEDFPKATKALLEAVASGVLSSTDAAARAKLIESHVEALTLTGLIGRMIHIETKQGL